jgi:hypothetical protein
MALLRHAARSVSMAALSFLAVLARIKIIGMNGISVGAEES